MNYPTPKLPNWKLQGLVGRLLDKYLNKTLIKFVSAKDYYEEIPRQTYQYHPLSVPTPEVYSMVLPRKAQCLRQDNYTLPDLYTLTLSNVFYSPFYNVILTNSRKVIAESISTPDVAPNRFSVANFYRRKIEKLSGTYGILRSIYNNYYHTLFDNLPRLYLISQYLQETPLTLLISSPPTSLEKELIEILYPNKFTFKVVEQSKFYQVENLVFSPFMTRHFCGFLPQEYLEFLTQKLCPKRPRNKIKRIYISRKNVVSRHIANEEELLQFLEPYGFQCYVLDDLSLEEQVELFYDAEIVIAPHGAALSNLLYSYQVKLLEIFPTIEVIPYYYYLCKSQNHSYRYWCNTRNADVNTPSFTVDVPAILALLQEWLVKETN